MRVVVTGARGFIGRHLLARLEATAGVTDIHATHSPGSGALPPTARTTWHGLDLTAPGAAAALIAEVRPTHLIHAAWITAHNDYWESPANLRWLAASCDLLQAFLAGGGQRFVQIGTAAEYDWSCGYMVEGVTPERPSTLYGVAKKSFHDVLHTAAVKAGCSAATGRVFFGYGPFENAGRLIPYACRQLARGEPAAFSSGSAWRDFLYIDDLADAVNALLQSSLQGAVNLSSGDPVRLAEIVTRLGEISGRPELVQLGARPDRAGDPPMLVGDSTRIRSTGWRPAHDLRSGLASTYRWWAAQGSADGR
ncbi:NAD(P)-dependent oxidoreductase [Rhodopseudomonas palustris]|uniref:NAD-dependent epimerase/dehydratase family protein n=1 Tax=Rhodopseudomonas palustris TaxID=1076 RepID=UPI002ACDA988|nr:NAD(P)-dependent oxidoreductase [Rhodopseudomonas palustris]WQG97485.1 NAD(P)-dependent oxidoreductase [Rhodopseudomonas palustris]